MSLPKLDQPIFTTKLPSNGQEVQFRQFLVKEEKILLIAEQSRDTKDLALAIRQILTNCIITELNIDALPIFDIEHLFLKLRSVSVGNVVKFLIEDYEDNQVHEIEFDLDMVQVFFPENHTNIINLDSKTKMKLKYPSIMQMEEMINFDLNDSDSIIDMIAKLMDTIYDEDTVYNFSEEAPAILNDFIENFSSAAMLEIQNFFETLPVLKHTINYNNTLGNNRTYTMEGLRDFFM